MSEKKILNEFLIEASKLGGRLFRNHVGTGWSGVILEQKPDQIRLEYPRFFKAGLCTGSSDLIGWSSIIITKEMIGRSVAVFTACEIKHGATRTTKQQTDFLNIIIKHGGIAFIGRTLADFEKNLGAYKECSELTKHSL